MAGMSLATTAFAKAAIGSTEIQKISIGSTEIWSAIVSAYDASANGGGAANTISSFSITAAAGADVFVAASWDRDSATGVTSVTCGGTPMTQIASVNHSGTASYGPLRLYRLAGAGTGSSLTISASVSGIAYYTASAISFTDVRSTLSPTTSVGNSNTASQTVTLTGGVGLFAVSASTSPTNYTSFSGMTARTTISSLQTRLVMGTVSASGTVSATSTGTNRWASIFVPL
ncbi:minor tail protein [Mycobacterium phage Smeagol]|nr:minor tail protein [Mycobacterium phage Smeagol]